MISYRSEYFRLKKMDEKLFSDEVLFSLFVYMGKFKDKLDLLMHFDDEIKYGNLDELEKRILANEPYQYVIGKTSFLGHDFIVNKSVLIPRQETENLVTKTIDKINIIFGNKHIDILDMCTGSGCIGISLKLSQNCSVFACDISHDAIEVAKNNAHLNKTNIDFIESDLFKNISNKKFDCIICNPPYISSQETVDFSTLKYEPHIALFANNGTEIYERFFNECKPFLNKEFLLAFEIGEDQKDYLLNEAKKYFPKSNIYVEKDIYNKDRFLFIEDTMNKEIEEAAEKLANGGIVAFPTETVMGLGIVFDNFEAYKKLNLLKKRPEDKPYSLMLESIDDIDKYAILNDKVRKVINRFLPGPLTILLPAKDNLPNWVTHGSGVVGIRVPDFKVTHELIKKAGKPLLVPSANPAGEPPALDDIQVSIYFGNSLDYIVLGKALQGVATTIVDLTSIKPVLIRQGSIELNDILKVFSEEKL